MTVTFETKCWEGDWKKVLDYSHLFKRIQMNYYPFDNRIIFINNVEDYDSVKQKADELINTGLITDYYIVKNYAEEVLDFFGLTKEMLGNGYVYSIAELTAIYLCKTDYLLHYSSDSALNGTFDWITPSLKVFSTNDIIKVINPCWNNKYEDAKRDSFAEGDDFYYGFGFSDQCYLIRTEDFKDQIYNSVHIKSTRYPKYGGELFEKRVDSWMRNHNWWRATYKHGSYIHPIF